MSDTNATGEEFSDDELAILRQIPGFRLDEGWPCTCGVDHLWTVSRRGYSDTMVYSHQCKECGNEFVTFIEG